MSRPEEIRIDVPALQASLRAQLKWDGNEELCEQFVDSLPLTTCLSHALASGYLMYAPMRLVGLYEPGRDEAEKPAKPHISLSRVPIGSISIEMDNYKAISIYYGPVTEPLPETPPVAEVVEDDLTVLKNVGREVWLANFLTHEVIQAEVDVSGR